VRFWKGFSEYVGIQGLLALGLGGGYIYAAVVGVILPEGYTELITLVLGFYFAKNGRNIINRVRPGAPS